jgi:RND family efflux transporter MFP subunit
MSRKTIVPLAIAGGLLTGFMVREITSLTVAPVARRASKEIAAEARAESKVERWVAAEGRVVTYPGGDVRVSTERAGKLTTLLAEENTRVRAGDLLAEIDSDELRAALEETRARIAEAEADLELATRMLARREGLVSREAIAIQLLDETRRDHDAAKARLAALGAERDRLAIQIEKCRITAPISGTISHRFVDAGEVLEAGDELATIVDLDRVRVHAEADEADAGSFVLGARAEITSDAYPGTVWAGSVEEVPGWVEPRSLKPADPARPSDTRILAIKVRFDEPSPLKVGTTVELRVAAR